MSDNAIQRPDVIDTEVITKTSDPEITLTMALRDAPTDGLSVPELMHFTGMGRT